MQRKLSSFTRAAFLLACTLLLSGCGGNLISRVSNFWSLGCCGGTIVILDIIALIELAGSTRSASSKIIWGLVIVIFPLLGCILYYFFGRH